MTKNGRSSRAAGAAAALVLVALALTTDVRSYGLIPDGREMLSAGVSVARFGEIGVSRDFANAPRRPGGDAVSRYGMGLSLVDAIPAVVARVAGAARTSTLFVLVPILCLAGAAWASARTARRLGVSALLAAACGAGLVLSTPLWGYAGSDYGEPLQALAVALSVLALVERRDDPASRRWQIVLGVSAGYAILTKTLLAIVVLPLVAAAAFTRRERSEEDSLEGNRDRGRASPKAGRAARGRASRRPLLSSFIGILFLWSLFEFVRFGRLGGGYGGETFTYPFFSGLLRLTLLPNKGLLWYAPIVLLAIPGFLVLRRKDTALAFALAGSSLALLFASSAWWAWDGQAGWGPRLVLPALPCLLALAAVAFASSAAAWRAAGVVALVAGLGVNALGALTPFPAIYALSSRVSPQPISESRAAGTPYEVGRRADGVLVATAAHHLSLTPAWSPIRVHALALLARAKGAWDGALPPLDPPFRPAPAPEAAPALKLALDAPRPGIWRLPPPAWADPYREALRDQLVRAIDVKDISRANALAEELERREEEISLNDPSSIALRAEVLRLGGGAGRAAADGAAGDSTASAALSYLSRKSPSSSSFLCNPSILFVRAMAQPPGDVSCLPAEQRDAFAAALDAARRRGFTLTDWNRAIAGARP